MNLLRPLFLFLSLASCLNPIFGQNHRSSDEATDGPGQKLTFNTRVKSLETSDSVRQIFLHPQTQEALRLYQQGTQFLDANGKAAEGHEQIGILRENNQKIEIPLGEVFFAFDENHLYTESYQESNDRSLQLVNIKKYAINKERLILLNSKLDTLSGKRSPHWHHLDGKFILSPWASLATIHNDNLLVAQPTEQANRILMSFFSTTTAQPSALTRVDLGASVGFGNQTINAFGVRDAHLSSKAALVHSVYRLENGQLRHLFSATDLQGNPIWEKQDLGYRVMKADHDYEEFFVLSDRPLVHQFVHCIDATSGQKRWEVALYETYNSDPSFEFELVRPEEVVIMDMASVMKSQYLAVIIARKSGTGGLMQAGRLFLFDRMGKLAYRYEIPEKARYLRIKDLESTIGLASEKAIHRFIRR